MLRLIIRRIMYQWEAEPVPPKGRYSFERLSLVVPLSTKLSTSFDRVDHFWVKITRGDIYHYCIL